MLIAGIETDAVIIDNMNASFRAVEELIRHNHRNIAIIGGRPDSLVSQERLRGYYNAMQTYDLPVNEEWVVWGDFTQTGGYQMMKKLCASADRPTAVYVTNYAMTIGAVLALHKIQLRIPEDMSLIGFDPFESFELI